MSFIRNTNNPEALYIYNSVDGNVYIRKGSVDIGSMPTKIFIKLLKKWKKKMWHRSVKHKGAKVEEVDECEGKDIDTDTLSHAEWMILYAKEMKEQIKLSYGNWHVYMWGVTWFYIVYSNKLKV